MESITISEFKNEVEATGVKNPKVSFNNNSVYITSLPYFDDILTQLFLWFCSSLFLYDISYLFVCLLFFAFSLYFFYFNFIGLDVCEINLETKTLTFRNRIFLFNIVRKLFGIKLKVTFEEINNVSYSKGTLLNRAPGTNWNKRFYLLIDTYKNKDVIISQFKNQKEAETIVSILNKIIINKKL